MTTFTRTECLQFLMTLSCKCLDSLGDPDLNATIAEGMNLSLGMSLAIDLSAWVQYLFSQRTSTRWSASTRVAIRSAQGCGGKQSFLPSWRPPIHVYHVTAPFMLLQSNIL